MDPRDLYHRYVPRALHARVKGYTGSISHRVESAMTAKGIPNRPTVHGSIWAVMVVRNEGDVLGETLRHLLDQGVTGIIVADNGSTDGTLDVLADAARTGPVHLVQDREPGFHQPEKISYLSHLAWRAGAEWIIPCDADEAWYAPGATIADYLAGSDAFVVGATMHDVLPMDDALCFGPDEEVMVKRLAASAATYTERKVAFRSGRGIAVLAGNHDVARGGARTDALHILHYQWRSAAQRARKARSGAQAHARAGHQGRGTHWAALAALGDAALAESWVQVRHEAQASPDWVRMRSPWRTWTSWDPAGSI